MDPRTVRFLGFLARLKYSIFCGAAWGWPLEGWGYHTVCSRVGPDPHPAHRVHFRAVKVMSTTETRSDLTARNSGNLWVNGLQVFPFSLLWLKKTAEPQGDGWGGTEGGGKESAERGTIGKRERSIKGAVYKLFKKPYPCSYSLYLGIQSIYTKNTKNIQRKKSAERGNRSVTGEMSSERKWFPAVALHQSSAAAWPIHTHGASICWLLKMNHFLIYEMIIF